MATGAFLRADGDLFGIHESSVSRIIRRVSMAIASLRGQYITFPTGNNARAVNQGFMQVGGIPGIVGAIDCTMCQYSLQEGTQQNYSEIGTGTFL